MKKVSVFSLMLVGLMFLSGCERLNGTSTEVVNHPEIKRTVEEVRTAPPVYRLRTMDPISIRYSGVTDLAPIDVEIDENGEISLLHIPEPIKAEGLTQSELAAEIEKRYIEGEIYTQISVSVTMTAKAYYVEGEVLRPGQFPLTTGTTFLQAIASASGFSDFADEKDVEIRRSNVPTIHINAKDVAEGLAENILIETGDIIFVGDTWY